MSHSRSHAALECVSKRRSHVMNRLLCALLALALLATACGSSDDPAGPGLDSDADLLFTASTPANGNAHLDNPTVVYAANADASGLDRLTVTQTISGVTH